MASVSPEERARILARVRLGFGGAVFALGIAVGATALVEHHQARAAWEVERARQGSESYDAGASDAAYLRARHAHERASFAAPLLVLGAALVFFAAGPERELTPAPTRVPAVALLDALVVAGFAALGLLDDGESAALAMLARAGPPAGVALLAVGYRRGRTPAMRAFGLRCAASVPAALAAAVLWPLAGVAALGRVHPAFAHPAARLAGVRIGRAG